MSIIPFLQAAKWLWKLIRRKKQTGRILLVEDDPMLADLFELCLKRCGYVCTVASTAEAALALIERNNITVAFVDMRLTYMPGWELIPLIWRYSPKSLVVVTCGEISDILKIPAPRKMFVVLEKPPDVAALEGLFSRIKL